MSAPAAPAGGPSSSRSRQLPYRRVLGYTYLGYLANNVLPARLGELVRSHALGEGEGISRTTVLGTVVVERDRRHRHRRRAGRARGRRPRGRRRDVDGGRALGAGVRGSARRRARRGDAQPPAAGRGAGHRVRRALPAGPRAGPATARGAGGRRPARGPSARALVLSAAAWTASIATFMAGGQAVGIELTLAQGALLSSGVALATIVPSAPGYLGTFELTAVVDRLASSAWTADAAFAMALLVHAMILARDVGRWRRSRRSAGRGARHRTRSRWRRRPTLDLGSRAARSALRAGVVRPSVGMRRGAAGAASYGLERQRLAGSAGDAQELERVALVHLGDDGRRPRTWCGRPAAARASARLVHRQNDRHDPSGPAGPLK